MFSTFKTLLRVMYVTIRGILFYPLLLLRKTAKLTQHEIKSILFLRHDRIGDMVLSTAVLKSLKRDYPEAKITVLASERNFEILKHNPQLGENSGSELMDKSFVKA